MIMTRYFAIVLSLGANVALAGSAHASERGWRAGSDVGVILLGSWSAGVPALQGDARGALQAGMSVGATYLVTTGLKETVKSMRPDGSDNRSFPSGHTSTAFAAATSIWKRRGEVEGVPATALAAFVGVARVKAGRHRWGDVAAGAALGTVSGLLLTRPLKSERMAFVPWIEGNGGGATIDFLF